ncbi:MAG: lytic transglycosylase domain-containing protein [Thiobacillaceae bacterium]|jgi:soluble lytic murein transglycosylase|nr:lytic transglycosylase domain-containing protein [Thiobacillaceae bacterium]
MVRIVWLVLIGFLWGAQAAAAPGDTAVQQAQQAFAERKPASFEKAARAVPSDHVLKPYIEYWQLMLDLPRAGDDRVANFLAANPGSWLAERLRGEWLKMLGTRGAWPAYMAEYPRLVRPDVAHQCYAYRAEFALGNRARLREAVGLWFSGRDQPSACNPLFEELIGAGLIGNEDVWRRFRLALQAGNPGVAKALVASLPQEQRPALALIDRAQKEAARLLDSGGLDLAQRGQREIAIYAVEQIARSNSAAAELALRKLLPGLTGEEQRNAWARVAVWAARRHEPAALDWFRQAGTVALNDAQREWWARAALRAGDWRTVLEVIDSMGEASRTQPTWRYWRGRALKQAGQGTAATAIFLELSRQHNYYGQLAQEELGAVMQVPAAAVKVGDVEVEAITRHPGIARAAALYKLGLRSEATSEWAWAIRGFTDAQLLAAAELAHRLSWYDRAINTAERTRDMHDFELRFLAPYRDLAQRAASENQLDEAWIFGLMRQESRFINVARSNVGASGLMQIMPSTARWIAKQLGIKRFNTREMQDPARNIQFGAYYLKHVQDSLDGSPVLATAAYNAGPGRAQRWRTSESMEAAVYIESIPFDETRDYVKKVMSNAMYYAARFDQPSVLLKDRLGEIPPRRAALPDASASDKAPSLELAQSPG